MQQDQLERDHKNQDLQNLERLNQASHKQVFRFIIMQLLATILLSVTLFFFDRIVAYSSLTGGLIATLANAWFALKVFWVKPTVKAETLLAAFYVGEIFKLILTGAMFIMAFVLIQPLSVVALLVTYFIIHMTPAVLSVFGAYDQTMIPPESVDRAKR